MVNFKALGNSKRLAQDKQYEIIDHLGKIPQPSTPIKDKEDIFICGEMLRCFVFAKKSQLSFDTAIVELVKQGHTILCYWNEFDKALPTTVFTWHQDLQ
jgi:hypothetical protein